MILVVAAGDAKIDNAKYKAQFRTKAKMLSFDEAEPLIGHAVGGVCPFAVKDGVDVYLDPVSYTHLDVYKRQMIPWTLIVTSMTPIVPKKCRIVPVKCRIILQKCRIVPMRCRIVNRNDVFINMCWKMVP